MNGIKRAGVARLETTGIPCSILSQPQVQGDFSVCLNDTIKLSLSPNTYDNYFWLTPYLGSANAAISRSNPEFKLKFINATFNGLGAYSALVVDNGCSVISDTVTITQQTADCNTTTDIDELNTFAQIVPNPNNGNFEFQILQGNLIEYQIFDAQGRLILKGINPNIHLSDQPKGIYFMVAFMNTTTMTKKIIIE